jgi:hypothetical protein
MLFFFSLFTISLLAQEGLDTNTQKGIALPSNKPNVIPPAPIDLNKELKRPTADLNNPLTEPKPFSMILDSDLMDAGEELQKRWNDNKLKATAKYDQYLGDFKTKSSYLGLQSRDFGSVDGDYVRIIVNDVVVENSLRLSGYFKGINIDLVAGLNRIDIIAINEGSASPNTGHFIVLDHEGKTITNQKWNLYSSGKATMIILKE